LQFYYCYDNDEAGFKSLWEMKDYIPVYAFTTDIYNDLDEARNQIKDYEEFKSYLANILKKARLFKYNTKKWNDEFYNSESFSIEDDILYMIKDDTKIKVSTTPFLITKITNKYGVEYLTLKTKNSIIEVPKETMLNTKKVMKGFNFTTAESKYISRFVKELLDENSYPNKYIKTSEITLNGYLHGDVILSRTNNQIKEIISFKEDGIWYIKYSDDFEYKKISGYKITDFDVFEHLLTGKKIYEFEYSNRFESYKDSFKNIDEFTKKIIIDKKLYPKLSLAISTSVSKLKTSNIEKRLPDIKAGFYLSDGKILYAGQWQFTPEQEYLSEAIKDLQTFISQYPDRRKSLAVLYSVIASMFAFVRKQLGQEAMIPITCRKGTNGKNNDS